MWSRTARGEVHRARTCPGPSRLRRPLLWRRFRLRCHPRLLRARERRAGASATEPLGAQLERDELRAYSGQRDARPPLRPIAAVTLSMRGTRSVPESPILRRQQVARSNRGSVRFRPIRASRDKPPSRPRCSALGEARGASLAASDARQQLIPGDFRRGSRSLGHHPDAGPTGETGKDAAECAEPERCRDRGLDRR